MRCSAYIAASRRSDRSLEARIESARRASHIHKRRTGRALRVTEQDVVNEEMYEEEDDDLPTLYQRLTAHMHTPSTGFNKKLHDYIATQHGVRTMFMSQYQSPPYQPIRALAGQQPTAASMPPAQGNNWLNPWMLPPQQLAVSAPQDLQQSQGLQQPQDLQQPQLYHPAVGQQQPQPYHPAAGQKQGFRQSPYLIPHRSQSHQRSLSIQMPPVPNFDSVISHQPMGTAASTPQGDLSRRMSLPPHAFQNQVTTPMEGPLSLSQSPVQPQLSSPPQPISPSATSTAQSSHIPDNMGTNSSSSSSSFSYVPGNYPYSAQALNSNPLSMSLPPESQQFFDWAFDFDDACTAPFMSGSDNLPQSLTPTYTYNPNPKPRTPDWA